MRSKISANDCGDKPMPSLEAMDSVVPLKDYGTCSFTFCGAIGAAASPWVKYS